MNHQTLMALLSDEFTIKCSCIAVPKVLHYFLQRCDEIKSLRSALDHGLMTEEGIRQFSNDLFQRFERGTRFEHEFVLAAIATALESRATPFAEEFLTDLAKLKITELSMAIRVAQQACSQHSLLAGNQMKQFSWSEVDAAITEWTMTHEDPPKVSVGQTEQTFQVGTA